MLSSTITLPSLGFLQHISKVLGLLFKSNDKRNFYVKYFTNHTKLIIGTYSYKALLHVCVIFRPKISKEINKILQQNYIYFTFLRIKHLYIDILNVYNKLYSIVIIVFYIILIFYIKY